MTRLTWLSPQRMGARRHVEAKIRRKGETVGTLQEPQWCGTEPAIAVASDEGIKSMGHRLHARQRKQRPRQSSTWKPQDEREHRIKPLVNPAVRSNPVGNFGPTRPILKPKNLLSFRALIGNESNWSQLASQPLKPLLALDAKPAFSIVNDRASVSHC